MTAAAIAAVVVGPVSIVIVAFCAWCVGTGIEHAVERIARQAPRHDAERVIGPPSQIGDHLNHNGSNV